MKDDFFSERDMVISSPFDSTPARMPSIITFALFSLLILIFSFLLSGMMRGDDMCLKGAIGATTNAFIEGSTIGPPTERE